MTPSGGGPPQQGAAAPVRDERDGLLDALAHARHFLRLTVRGLTDEQARRRTTVSQLCLAGIVKHVTAAERTWATFATEGASAFAPAGPEAAGQHARGFVVGDDEPLDGLLADYARVAERTDDLVRSLDDLGVSHPLPEAPWFEPGARWSARQVFLHVVAETAQHAGHADIVREALDGAKSMG